MSNSRGCTNRGNVHFVHFRKKLHNLDAESLQIRFICRFCSVTFYLFSCETDGWTKFSWLFNRSFIKEKILDA